MIKFLRRFGRRTQQTSVDAFEANRDNFKTLGDMIVAYLSHTKTVHTRAELAKALNIPTATMSGRIRDLLDHGRIVEEPGRYTCGVTGNSVRGVSAA